METKRNFKIEWDLAHLFYRGIDDPNLENDILKVEKAYSKFDKKYRNNQKYLFNDKVLFEVLTEYEKLLSLPISKPLSYLNFVLDSDSQNAKARALYTKLIERFAKNEHKIVFLELNLGKIDKKKQKEFLKSKKLIHFHYFLKKVFDVADHNLSESEEKILGLKSQTCHSMWVDGTERILYKKTISFQGKEIPLPEAVQKVADLPHKERRELYQTVIGALKSVSDIAENEINAIITNKKINDELRGYKEPFDSTILHYQNDKKSILNMVETVTKNMSISHRFYELKAKILKLPYLEYCDRNVGIGENQTEITFEQAVKIIKNVFGGIDEEFLKIMNQMLDSGQIDVFPKIGKRGGAYSSGGTSQPTMILLNYTNSLDQVMTFAHELGHSVHTELSKAQTPLYQYYSTATAEVASTLFESFVFDAMFETLSSEEKIIALHKKINDDIQTIFRQIACFNFEKELHETIRERGAMTKEEIGDLMNKHMSSYLGPITKMHEIDGNYFVYWSHIRNFFYVYSYAYGQLVSKALYKKFKENREFINQIKSFLSAGGSMSPDQIFKSIGVDTTKPEFFEEGLMSINQDITKLKRMIENKQR